MNKDSMLLKKVFMYKTFIEIVIVFQMVHCLKKVVVTRSHISFIVNVLMQTHHEYMEVQFLM